MPTYGLNVSMENIRTITVMFLEIFIIWMILYYALKIIRTNARTIQIFKGILLVLIIDALAKLLGLQTLQLLTGIFLNWGFLAVIIIFQPEIRQLLERIGKSNVFSRMTTLTGNEKENLVDQIVTAVMLLSSDQTGALISIEQSHSLEDFIATGTRLNSDVTAELLTSIFVTSTPLHDGAVIIQGDQIACASAYFPPTNMELPSRYGARHRAAIGISEITDAVTIIVSEETGNISITEGGKIFHVDRQQLRNYLLRVICGEVTEVHGQPSPEPTDVHTIVVDEKENVRRGNTGVLSKLAVKKQTAPVSGKIETEEVIPAEIPEETPAVIEVPDDTEKRQKLYEAADQEASAAEIKLPHKRRRKKPSYPPQQSRTAQPETIPQETVSEADTQGMKKAIPSQVRMSADEVKAAREAEMKRLRNEEIPVIEPIIDLDMISEEEERKYDTSKLDISKIVGFNDELDRQFEMIDRLPDTKKSSRDGKGGDRQ